VRPATTPVASAPNILVSWAATPVVAVAKGGSVLYPKSVWAASQSFYPFSPALPPSTLSVVAQRRETGFRECASAVLPPVPPGQMQFGPRVLVDLTGCGGADALVFGLGNSTAYSDSPRPQLESEQYFALDSLEFCGGKVKGAPGTVPAGGGAEVPPSVVYLPNPPKGTVNRRRRSSSRRRSERRRLLGMGGGGGGGGGGGPVSSSPPLRRSLLEESGTAASSTNGNGNGGNGNSNKNNNRAAAPFDAAIAAALLPTAPPPPAPPQLRHPAPAGEKCFVSGFGNVTYGRTAAATLVGDYYWSGWGALEVGDGLAWLNLDLVSDASPPPVAQPQPSTPPSPSSAGSNNYGRPHWKSAVYAFGLEKGNGGLFAPQSIQVAAVCDARDAEQQRASDARCSPPGTAPPVFEVAGRSALPGSRLRPCALASLGPAPAADGAGSGQPLTLDLTACGTVDLLRFRLVPPVFGDQYSFGLDSLRVCSSGGGKDGGSGGGGGFKPPASKEVLSLPDVDPPSWKTAPVGYLNDAAAAAGLAGGIGSMSTGKR